MTIHSGSAKDSRPWNLQRRKRQLRTPRWPMVNRTGTSVSSAPACGPQWPEHGTETQIGGGLKFSNSILLQCFSRVERVTGIEPALSAWELFELMGFVLGSLRVSRSRAAWSVPWVPAVMAR